MTSILKPISGHLPLFIILLPLVFGLVLLGLRHQSNRLQSLLGLLAVLLELGLVLLLVQRVTAGDILVYHLGGWPAPWGIVLVADRLAALMLLTTMLLALCALWYASTSENSRGRYFQLFFQLELFGLSGAFLTGDLFNLFVFFEILLLASYGLLLHGGGARRIKAGLHYVVMNILGSSVFLLGAGLLYASLGSLNMADLAHKAMGIPEENLGLARAGGLLLFGVFALKAALLPLHLWLPAAYSASTAPVAALFTIMTKVGAYGLLRTQSLIFGSGDLANLYQDWLLPMGLLTLVFAGLGLLAARDLGRLIAWLVIASSGTLIIGLGLGEAGIAAALYYLPHSSLAAGAGFLLVDAIGRRRPRAAKALSPDVQLPDAALWGGLFFVCAMLLAGLPPLSGFIGKLLLLRAGLGQPSMVWVWAGLLGTALLMIIALSRAGSLVFFKTMEQAPAQELEQAPGQPVLADETRVRPNELGPILGLLGLCLILTIAAGPVFDFTKATALQLGQTDTYLQAVLTEKPAGGQP